MANSTVYPFGPGGELPAGIGVVNDLVTGGVSDALSAQMGVVLKSLVDTKVDGFDCMEDGLYFVDEYLNIGVMIDSNGLQAANLITAEDI